MKKGKLLNKDEILERGGVHEKTLRRLLISHTYMASQFKTIVAKGLYNYFQAKNVLDFSAGWGDRLFAASSLDIKYLGLDPNYKLKDTYHSIIKEIGNSKKIKLLEFIEAIEDNLNKKAIRNFAYICGSWKYCSSN